jgi:hypothetical protein
MTKVTQKQVTWQLKNNDENKSKLQKEKRYKIQNKNQWESFWLFT